MKQLTTRLLLLALIVTCCFAVGMSFWSPTAVAQSHGTYCDDHAEEEFEDEGDEEDWEDEEEWEDWGMEEAMFEVEILNQHLEMVNKLIEIVEGTREITNDATATALMSLVTSRDFFEEPEEYVHFLEQELPKVKDVAVRRAIHLQLAESYVELEMSDKVKEHLSLLIQGKN